MTNTVRENTFTIPVENFSEFIEKIEKLNRKAVKLGCDPVTYKNLGKKVIERTVEIDHEFHTTKTYKVEAFIIELDGKAPKLEGFEFIARIEYLQDGKSTLFHTVPGSIYKIDERFRSLTAATCEHCNRIRRRNDTFVVREITTGQQTQVGRQCLADFTGTNNPAKAAFQAELLGVYDDYEAEADRMWTAHFEDRLDTLEALALTSAYIGEFGWVPKSQSEFHNPTATQVSEHFSNFGDNSPKAVEFRRTMKAKALEEFHQKRALEVHTWVAVELAAHAKSDYELNLVTLVNNDVCERRHLGIVCSAVAAYQRAMNQKVEYAERKASMACSKHIGTVGERVKGLKVTVQFLRSFEGNFGPTTLVKFVTEDGNLLTWFASGDRSFKVGETITIDGTVKGHAEYQTIKETQLKIVKVK